MLNYMRTPPTHFYLECSGSAAYMETHSKYGLAEAPDWPTEVFAIQAPTALCTKNQRPFLMFWLATATIMWPRQL